MMTKRKVKVPVKDDSVQWALVRFREDGILSDPIKFHLLEANGEDAISAQLEEGDMCMAPYLDGEKYEAKIVRILSEKGQILKEKLILSSAKEGNDDAQSFDASPKKKKIQKKGKENDDAQPVEASPKKKKTQKKGKDAVLNKESKTKDVAKNSKKKKKDDEEIDEAELKLKNKKKEIAILAKERKEAQAAAMQQQSSMLFGNAVSVCTTLTSNVVSINDIPSTSSNSMISNYSYMSDLVGNNNFNSSSYNDSIAPSTSINNFNTHQNYTNLSHPLPGCNAAQSSFSSFHTYSNNNSAYSNSDNSFLCNSATPHTNNCSDNFAFTAQQTNSVPHAKPACHTPYPSNTTACSTLPSSQTLPSKSKSVTTSSALNSTLPLQPISVPAPIQSTETNYFRPSSPPYIPLFSLQSPSEVLGEAINTSVHVEQVSEDTDHDCPKCEVFKVNVRDLNIKIQTLQNKIFDLEQENSSLKANVHESNQEQPNIAVKSYHPKTRARLEYAEYYTTDPSKPNIKEGFVQLAPGSEVVVKRVWLESALNSVQKKKKMDKDKTGPRRKTSNKSAVLKHLMDGFYSPKDLSVQGGTKSFLGTPIYASLKRYAEAVLEMHITDFNISWNEKMSQCRKVVKRHANDDDQEDEV